MVIGAAFALLSANDANSFDAVVQLLALGAVFGVVLGLAFGLVVGSIAGLLRRRYATVWPVAAGTTFLLAFGIGCALVAAGTERWEDAGVGCAWAFLVAAVLATVAAIASLGMRGGAPTSGRLER